MEVVWIFGIFVAGLVASQFVSAWERRSNAKSANALLSNVQETGDSEGQVRGSSADKNPVGE